MTDLSRVGKLALAEHGLATIAVARADGTVHASVVNAGLIDDPVTGRKSVGFVARGGTRKLALLRESGLGTIVFRRGWEWASVQGGAHLIGPDDPDPAFPADGVPQLLRDVFVAATGTHDDWAEYDRVMAAERRCAVFIAAERMYGNP
ncbi:pyridoxamine 5'-phosphate oxidase family protein [Amycolatopsis acidiphila]|uniref:Pyridoxamine 5'-phosphate oxidase n=1 Tax=Amycolatopsis acidiphila TaxID=715473 RepID=A0A558A5Z9_9PSEU|nr:pyridoxamine 5'-phosphate oxidase family protein [Amycolatopsis acidiphila]TVT19691.1 pyridoxamine 5'-phosphate oxidase [Amycolatopsis acidiphila]UIJ61790.1 pyridoxamine 5'-phosphate oxidase family protein [Amycolatopsis acidiphila]GHG57915.1 pyridoxamine 5'-phosphate oxidase [Amycolatopsis acidiphila]